MKKRKIGDIFALDGMKIQVHPRRYASERGCKGCFYDTCDCSCTLPSCSTEEQEFIGECGKLTPKDEYTKFVLVGPADGTEVECYQRNTDA